MSNYGYEYAPLGHVRKRHYFWVFLVVFGLLAIVDVVLLRHVYRPTQTFLDNYRPLKTVHEGIVADYDSTSNASFLRIPPPDERAVVTALFSESYVPAVIALGHSLRTSQTSARRIVLYFPERTSLRSMCQLQAVGWELQPIERISPPSGGQNVYYRFVDNYSKLHIWALDKIGIKNVVFLDADTLVLRNFDELWSLPFEFAAVPDVYGDRRGFTRNFNGGVLFLRTSSATFDDLVEQVNSDGYHHGEAEQGLLNAYFAPTVTLLPYLYNANLMIKQRSPVLWQAMEKDMRVVHYTMLKPFLEEDRHRAREGKIWEPEMLLWDAAWREVATRLKDEC